MSSAVGGTDSLSLRSKLPQDYTKCSICNEKFKNPLLLPCLHSFCGSCIDFDEQSASFTCPRCGLKGKSQNTDDKLINALLDPEKVCCDHHEGYKCYDYCKTCRVLVCSLCLSENHSKCEVFRINSEENTQQAFRSLEIATKQDVQETTDVAASTVNLQRKRMTERSQVASEISSFFGQLKTKVLGYLNTQEKELQLKANDYFCEDEKRMSAMKERFENDQELFTALGDATPNISMLNVLQSVKNDVVNCKNSINDGTSSTTLKLLPCKENIERILTSSLATLELANENEASKTASDVSSTLQRTLKIPLDANDTTNPRPLMADGTDTGGSKPIEFYQYADYVCHFSSFTQGDAKNAVAVGMTWIEEKTILMVDRFNKKIKLVAENGVVLFALLIPNSEPWDVAHVKRLEDGTHTCAVTMPKTKQLMYLKVHRRHVETIRTIYTRAGYSCLAHDAKGHSLVCGLCPPWEIPAIHLIDAEGVVKMEFYKDSAGVDLFMYPRSVDVSCDGVIIVCDWKKCRILFIRTDGFVLGDYTGTADNPLLEPIGTTLDGLGNILVSDSRNSNIHVVSIKDRKLVGILDLNRSIPQPREINLLLPDTGHGAKLAVATGTTVNVFDMWSPPPDV